MLIRHLSKTKQMLTIPKWNPHVSPIPKLNPSPNSILRRRSFDRLQMENVNCISSSPSPYPSRSPSPSPSRSPSSMHEQNMNALCTPVIPSGRTGYSKECEMAVNRQINHEYRICLLYHAMHCYFDRDTVALPGLARFFKMEHDDQLVSHVAESVCYDPEGVRRELRLVFTRNVGNPVWMNTVNIYILYIGMGK